MSQRYSWSRSPLVATVGLAALLSAPVGAQYGRAESGLQLPFENGRIRVSQISVPAGAMLPPLLDAAFLVPSSSRARFRSAARRAAAQCHRADIGFVLTGPWPPYHFVAAGDGT